MERLRALRNERGITQEELGRVVGVGKTTISQYENGVRTPDAEPCGAEIEPIIPYVCLR